MLAYPLYLAALTLPPSLLALSDLFYKGFKKQLHNVNPISVPRVASAFFHSIFVLFLPFVLGDPGRF